MPDRFENILAETIGRLGRALGSARGAQSPALAREGHEHVLAAAGAADAGKAILENAAVEIAGHHSIDTAPPESETRLETLLPFQFDRFEPGLENAIERRGLRLTRSINGRPGSRRAGRGDIHAHRPKPLGCSRARRCRSERDGAGKTLVDHGARARCPEKETSDRRHWPLSNFLAFRRQMDCMVAALELACGNIKNKRPTLVDVVETEETSGGVIPEDDAVPPVGH